MTEYFVKKQEKRIDEFFHEVYDFFNKNFMRMADSYKLTMKSKLQQEFAEYRYTYETLKSNLDYMSSHDSFGYLLEKDLFNISSSAQNTQATNTANILSELNTEKPDLMKLANQYLEDSLEMKTGLTPLVKKFKLIDFILKQRDNYNPSSLDHKKEPFKDFAHINTELENFLSRISSVFSQDLPTISHPHTPHTHLIEKIARIPSRVLPFDTAGKSLSHSPSEENLALKKRLSILEVDSSSLEQVTTNTSTELEQPKESKSPKASQTEIKSQPTLTPTKSVTYRLPTKENSFTANQGWFNEEFSEISYQSQTISVHNNLAVGDLVSVNGSPHRIIHKEWVFPVDMVHMVNVFTGEKIEEVHHSRLNAMVDQIITKKYQVIKLSKKQDYFLVMDMVWDKSEHFKKLPRIIETKNVLDKRLEDDIKEALLSEKKVVVHVLKIKNEDIIVSYRKERF